MKLKELFEEQISKVTTEEVEFICNDKNVVGCGGLIFGGSCGTAPTGPTGK